MTMYKTGVPKQVLHLQKYSPLVRFNTHLLYNPSYRTLNHEAAVGDNTKRRAAWEHQQEANLYLASQSPALGQALFILQHYVYGFWHTRHGCDR